MGRHPRWTRQFLSEADFDAIVHAIAGAEAHTSGEIRVHFDRRLPRHSDGRPVDVIKRAHAVFRNLGMDRETERNGVLVYLALEDRRLAIVGDEGIHARVGDEYWARLRDHMVERLRAAAPRDAILPAIHEVGRVLREHFPRRPDAPPVL